ncbi:MAG TPA: Mu-like prophage major head subunit gpT family protein, partial [Planctomycetota bacterium]|nr:Mu-like prophage major head subunit gpT family protein [Planctomycetota bacterium]
MPGLGLNSALGSRAIIGKFYHRLEQEEGKLYIPRIGMRFSSDQESETYRWLGQVPQMREWFGGRNPKGLSHEGITIANRKFESTLEISVDDLRRDKTSQISLRIGELAIRTASHWLKLLNTLIEAGTSSLCYDGHYFFDTAHAEGSSGTQLNALAAGQVPKLDVTTATAPTPDEMASAILGVIGYMLGYKDDQGEPMNELAREFIVMVP